MENFLPLSNYREVGNFHVVQFSRNFTVSINPRKLKSVKYFSIFEKFSVEELVAYMVAVCEQALGGDFNLIHICLELHYKLHLSTSKIVVAAIKIVMNVRTFDLSRESRVVPPTL